MLRGRSRVCIYSQDVTAEAADAIVAGALGGGDIPERASDGS